MHGVGPASRGADTLSRVASGRSVERVDRWLEELAEALGVEPLGGGETGELLRASRDVAHGVERRFAPLASFLLGVATERGTAAGASRDEAFATAVEQLRWTLPPPDASPPSSPETSAP
jgi:hypothetical protein